MGSLLTLFRRRGYRYLLGPFRFTTDAAAPLTSPYTEPGAVGSLTPVQNDGQFSTSAGKLNVPTQATPVSGDLGFYSSAGLVRVAGRSFLLRVNKISVGTYYPSLTWESVARVSGPTAGPYSIFFEASGSVLAIAAGGVQVTVGPAFATATDYDLLLILRASGAFYLIKGGVFTNWTLLWVDPASTTTPLYPSMGNYNSTALIDDVRVLDLGPLDARFATDNGLATNRLVSPTAGTTTTSTADALIEATFVFNNTITFSFYFREQDTSNRWRFYIDSTTVQLLEFVAGVQTGRGAAAHGITHLATARVVLVIEGNVHKLYVNNVLKVTYTDTNNLFLTQTTVRLQNVSGGVSELIAWPRTLSLPAGV